MSPRLQAAAPSLLFVTDPWDTLDHARDTTLRLMQECLHLGVEAWWCDGHSVRLEHGKITLTASRLKSLASSERSSQAFRFEPARAMAPARFGRILYRTDPPVDLAYLHPLQLLVAGIENSATELVNPPAVLFQRSEKIEGALLGGLAPHSVVSSQEAALEAFGSAQGKAVLKPLHQAQSKGVQLLDFGQDPARARTQLREATQGGTLPVILQEYLPAVQDEGELRLWLLNGRLLAHARKNPRRGEFKIDMDRGGFLSASHLSRRDLAAADKVGRRLRELRVRLAAVDLIAGKVTDFNLTSPGLLTPMETLLSQNLAEPVVRSLIRPWR